MSNLNIGLLLVFLFVALLLVAALTDFSRFRFWRKMKGGKWELWWVDVHHSYTWYRVGEFSRITGNRPYYLCRGTPTEEDWGAK